MTQYINKSALVAEIENLKRTTFTNFDEGVNCAVQTLLEIIDTLEVKDANEALRTEYEKGKADVIADTLSWLANVWPQYCSNPNIIDAYKEGVVKD